MDTKYILKPRRRLRSNFPRQTGTGTTTTEAAAPTSTPAASATNGGAPTPSGSDASPSGASSETTPSPASNSDSAPSQQPSSGSTSDVTSTTTTVSSSSSSATSQSVSSTTSSATSSSLSSSSSSSATSSASISTSTSPSSSATSTSTTTATTSFSSSGSSSSDSSSTTMSTIVTFVNGQLTTVTTPMPTALSSQTSQTSSSRTAEIAGTTAGAVALLLIALSAFFFYKRHQHKKWRFIEAITFRRRQQHSRTMLLDGEDMDGDFRGSGSYRDFPSLRSGSAAGSGGNRTPPPQLLLHARGSETGSIFREGVWPPPGEHSRLIDPLLGSASEVDLTRIVDDVMGPSGPGGRVEEDVGRHGRNTSFDSFPASLREASDTSGASGHTRDWSTGSQTALLGGGGAVMSSVPFKHSPLAVSNVGEQRSDEGGPQGQLDVPRGDRRQSESGSAGSASRNWLERPVARGGVGNAL